MEPTRKRRVLEAASFGARVAEEEKEALARYFVATDQWKQLVAGDKDIVYGAKGAGKSALYALLVQRKEALFDEGVLVVPVEKLSGVPVFQSLAEDPPASEAEFVAIWKLYFLVLAASVLREWGVETPEAKRVYAALEEAGLLQPRSAPAKILRGVRAYVKRIANPQTVETTVAVDVATGTPTATTRITLGEPAPHLEAAGYLSLDTLLEGADEALGALRFQVWLALDRLDVAFASREELERSALRAVFVAYRDMQALVNLRPKIFIRSDLWRRITEGGFREASHITRDLTLTWDRQSLLQLVVRRLLDNPEICELYGVVPNDVQTDALEQEAFIDRVFPPHVDPQKPESAFDWMLRATEDGLEHSEPREVIHLLSALRDAQLKRWEVGQAPPAGEALFDAASFREALKTVSRVRLEQTLLAENPKLKPFRDASGRRARHAQSSNALGPLGAAARGRGAGRAAARRRRVLRDASLEAAPQLLDPAAVSRRSADHRRVAEHAGAIWQPRGAAGGRGARVVAARSGADGGWYSFGRGLRGRSAGVQRRLPAPARSAVAHRRGDGERDEPERPRGRLGGRADDSGAARARRGGEPRADGRVGVPLDVALPFAEGGVPACDRPCRGAEAVARAGWRSARSVCSMHSCARGSHPGMRWP